MNKNNAETTVYQGIASRTGGDIYIGVVGPVRTGKSTFIKQFMESAVLPAIENDYDKQRARDELPQSASGKTVMTTEPKFVPDEAVSVSLSPGETVRVRMVDCVGYIVPEALGQEEDGAPRMVHTPWSEEPLPFKEAAELGTRKVIKEHSTVAMLVTQDGSFGEIPREAYVEAEEAVAKELEKAGTPFAVILNSAAPESREAVDLAYELEKKYNAPVALVNCRLLDKEDVTHILELILGEFPVNELCFRLPPWCSALKPDHPLRQAVLSVVKDTADRIQKMGDVKKAADATPQTELLEGLTVANVYPESGKAVLEAHLVKGLAYRVLSEVTGYPIADETAMYALLQKLADTAHAYAHLKQALDEVEETGYGIVMPEAGELHLEE
ncbi:MAG: stage IV sporulation protein A, partial [Clostridia bacterium]|nr:stage IV sporulation protein A [Clostridia bacterium]